MEDAEVVIGKKDWPSYKVTIAAKLADYNQVTVKFSPKVSQTFVRALAGLERMIPTNTYLTSELVEVDGHKTVRITAVVTKSRRKTE